MYRGWSCHRPGLTLISPHANLHAGCLILRIILTFAVLVCAGCAVHQPIAANWRLTKQGTGDVLIPPGVADPNLSRRTLAVDLAAGHGACPPAIRVKGKRVLVTVTREMLLQQPQGWLTAWAEGIESQGCIAHGEGFVLAARIAESLPLDPGLAFHLLYPSDRQSGKVDIAPPVRLQVVSPILRDGAAPDAPILETSGSGNSLTVTLKSSDNLIGYETAWYGALSKTSGVGFTITPLYAERHVNSDTERRAQPATNYIQFPPDAAFYRLFYKSGQTDYTALVVAAPTRAELERRIGVLDAASGSCDQLQGELCVAIPRRVAINPMVPVTVNGVEVMVAWGATVAEAIRNAGERQPEAVLPKLAVSRLYNGHLAPVDFDHSSPAVLRLILNGREEISWNR
jgi:hypothetical protein